MQRIHKLWSLVVIVAVLTLPALAQEAATTAPVPYKLDPVHSSVAFRVGHLGITQVFGRFNDVSGEFSLAGNDSTFSFTVKTASIDTGVERRDNHLRSADFFDAEKYPEITFVSTSVLQTETGFRVTGDLSLHGVTRRETVDLLAHGTAEFPAGTHRTGFTCEFTVRRSDYGMTFMLGPVSDEVQMMIGFEGIRQE